MTEIGATIAPTEAESNQFVYLTGASIMPTPEHRNAPPRDKAVAKVSENGKSAMAAVIHGSSDGGDASINACTIIQEELVKIEDRLKLPEYAGRAPIPSYARRDLDEAMLRASERIKQLGVSGADGVVSGVIICEDLISGIRYPVTFNAGDSGVYRVSPDGTVTKLTTDNTLFESLKVQGKELPSEVDEKTAKRILLKTVGKLKKGTNGLDVVVYDQPGDEVREGESFVVVSTGVGRTFPTEQGLTAAIKNELSTMHLDSKDFAYKLALRARRLQVKQGALRDISVAVLTVA